MCTYTLTWILTCSRRYIFSLFPLFWSLHYHELRSRHLNTSYLNVMKSRGSSHRTWICHRMSFWHTNIDHIHYISIVCSKSGRSSPDPTHLSLHTFLPFLFGSRLSLASCCWLTLTRMSAQYLIKASKQISKGAILVICFNILRLSSAKPGQSSSSTLLSDACATL